MDVNDLISTDDYYKKLVVYYPNDEFWKLYDTLMKSNSAAVRRNVITSTYTMSLCIKKNIINRL